jgi:hypothetical protein
MLSKKWIAWLSISISHMVFAGNMEPVCVPGNVSVPCAIQQWDLGVRALYLNPSHTITQKLFTNSTTDFNQINNRWGFGYQLTGSYHFQTGNSILMDWTHYDVTTTRSAFDVSQSNRFDQANLVLGQDVYFDGYKQARFYGGLQYANIRLENFHYGLNLPPTVNQIDHTDFRGVGPVFGIDFAYAISNGFSITANTSTSVIYGAAKNRITNYTPNLIVVSQTFVRTKLMVPGLEEKLGLNYKYQFRQGQLILDGGYQALNYFNAINRTSTTGIVNNDFGLFGPYFGIRWLGMA